MHGKGSAKRLLRWCAYYGAHYSMSLLCAEPLSLNANQGKKLQYQEGMSTAAPAPHRGVPSPRFSPAAPLSLTAGFILASCQLVRATPS